VLIELGTLPLLVTMTSLQTPMSLRSWASLHDTQPIAHCRKIWVSFLALYHMMRLLKPTGCRSGSLYAVLYAGRNSSPSNHRSIDTTDVLIADFRSVPTNMDDAVFAGEAAENRR
jgi:hypothetical protein